MWHNKRCTGIVYHPEFVDQSRSSQSVIKVVSPQLQRDYLSAFQLDSDVGLPSLRHHVDDGGVWR